MSSQRAWIFLLAIVACGRVGADTILFDGRAYQGVYVREGELRYYVQIPETGAVLSVDKTRVAGADVALSPDPTEREALLETWRRNNAAKNREGCGVANAPSDAKPAETAPIQFQEVPLGTALHVALRQEDMDYRVENGCVRVGPAQDLRQRPVQPVQTRTYALQATSADTLPKIVLANPASMGLAMSPRVAAHGGYGGSRTSIAYGPGPNVSVGSGPAYAGTGMQGGYGGMGGFSGGYRGGSFGGGGPTFHNVSELFMNIDDRIVGESPAFVGIQGLR